MKLSSAHFFNMPCNCDHLEASRLEIEISRVACLLDELDGKKYTDSDWNGYHKKVYNKASSVGDELTEKLCSRLQKLNVTKYSLEMQIWWRDHQKADKERLKKEMRAIKDAKAKEKALAKLSPYERKLLNIE